MASKPQPAYYGIITADVRYDRSITPNAKLLFSEITALCNATGECTAGNPYFARLYEVNPTTVSEWVSSLVRAGHIEVEIDRAAGNKRKIRIAIRNIPKTSSEKAEDPSSEKAEDNNTSINNTINSSQLRASHTAQVYELYLKSFKIPDYKGASETEKIKLLDAARKRYKLTPKRSAAISRRLEDAGFNMLRAAIIGYSRSDWHIGKNDRGWIADLEQFICRNYENVEKGANLYEQQREGKDPQDAWGHLT